MPLPTLDARLLKPYVSFLVLVQPKEQGSVDIVCREIQRFIEGDERSTVQASGLNHSPKVQEGGAEIVFALAYVTHRRPPWGGLSVNVGAEHGDRVNHLALVVQSGDLLAVHATENRVKDHLLRKQAKLELGGVGLLDRPALEEAFLSGEIATFWMGEGGGRRDQRGPRSKTTYGERLENTIDAIGDQRHTLSGARARAGEDLLGPGQEGVVGTNLGSSSAWYVRSNDIADFTQTVDRMLQAIAHVLRAGGGRERFVVFARYVDDLDAIERVYDITLSPPDSMPGLIPTEEHADLYDWFQSHLVKIEATGRRTARVTVAGDSGDTATVTVRPERSEAGGITFGVARAAGDDDLARRFTSAFDCLQPTMYYESGHTVTRHGVVSEYFSDVPFGGWQFETLDGVQISNEKPGDSSWSAIRKHGGSTDDDSLFGWVIRNRGHGWLYCDDGADELCDFVFLDEDRGLLEIWHVKACKSGDARQVAAVPYEQVCAQAVKNMPSLSPRRLADELEVRKASGAVGPLWYDGAPSANIAGMVAALRLPRASLGVTVNVMQPHVTEAMLRRARAASSGGLHDERQRLRRLDHLLLSTDDAVARLGAHLRVVTLAG